MIKSRTFVAGALVASALLLPSLSFGQEAGQQGATLAPPTHPGRFVSEPGQLEFRGVLTARPLQVQDAAKYGLSEAEVIERRDRAFDAMSVYTLVEYVDGTDEYLLEVGLGNEQAVAGSLMANGDFQYIEPDWIVYPIANCTNDNKLSQQWHHNANRMNSCNAWGLETGNPGVTVAICDTGIRTTHSDLQLHRKEGFNAVDNKWESNGGKINDINGHGTGTTGCAAANGNNNKGVSGTGWDLGHRMMRVSNSSGGGANMSDLTQAARLGADVGDKVSSVSYSGVQSSTVQSAGNYIRNKGALLVWAAGNDGKKMTGNRDDSVIVVGATTSSDGKSSFSNYGSFVDLMAPGSSVYTTSNAGNDAYNSVSGTSFSCPLTAGLCALIFAADPSLTPQEVEDILRAGCDDLGATGIDPNFGYGRIDSFNSLSMVSSCGVENYCNALDNSTGGPAGMSWSGSASILSNDLSLAAGPAPAGQFGLFILGDKTASVSSGDGLLCVGGALKRYGITQIDNFGFGYQAVDLGNLPGGVTVQAGESTYFSFWFRDTTVGGWNFADGLHVTWCD